MAKFTAPIIVTIKGDTEVNNYMVLHSEHDGIHRGNIVDATHHELTPIKNGNADFDNFEGFANRTAAILNGFGTIVSVKFLNHDDDADNLLKRLRGEE